MNIYTVRPLNAPPHPTIDIEFGEGIHAEAVYSIDYDDMPELLALMCPVGKNGSMINIIDDLHDDAVYAARVALRDALTEQDEENEIQFKLQMSGRDYE